MDGFGGRSDAALVTAIGRGRRDALAEGYRRHARAVYAVARGVLGDHPCAEEVVRETFLRLWQEPEHVDSGACLFAFAPAGRRPRPGDRPAAL